MTEKAKRQDGEEPREDREGPSADMSHERAPERATQCDLTGATTDENETVNETVVATEDAAQPTGEPEPTRTRRVRKVAGAQAKASEPAIESATEATQEATSISAIEADRLELEAQGFSAEEAQRLIDISKRLESSAEARESQAELKRLRFAQWLIERGILDEFSV